MHPITSGTILHIPASHKQQKKAMKKSKAQKDRAGRRGRYIQNFI